MCSNLRKLSVFPWRKTSLLNLLMYLICYFCHPLLATEKLGNRDSKLPAQRHTARWCKKSSIFIYPSYVPFECSFSFHFKREKIVKRGGKQILHKRKHFLKIQTRPNLISNSCLHLQLWEKKRLKCNSPKRSYSIEEY